MENNDDIIIFFESLNDSDWDVFVTEKWKVKDVLSHLIGWEREVYRELAKLPEGGNDSWFMKTDDYAEFNEKVYQEFKDYSPEALLLEMNKWRNESDKIIQKIGEDKIRQRPDMDWVFDEGGESHFEHHINQIKKVLMRE